MARRVNAPGVSIWAGGGVGVAEVRVRRGRRKAVDEYCIVDCVER